MIPFPAINGLPTVAPLTISVRPERPSSAAVQDSTAARLEDLSERFGGAAADRAT